MLSMTLLPKQLSALFLPTLQSSLDPAFFMRVDYIIMLREVGKVPLPRNVVWASKEQSSCILGLKFKVKYNIADCLAVPVV